jgi:hypothetical protein
MIDQPNSTKLGIGEIAETNECLILFITHALVPAGSRYPQNRRCLRCRMGCLQRQLICVVNPATAIEQSTELDTGSGITATARPRRMSRIIPRKPHVSYHCRRGFNRHRRRTPAQRSPPDGAPPLRRSLLDTPADFMFSQLRKHEKHRSRQRDNLSAIAALTSPRQLGGLAVVSLRAGGKDLSTGENHQKAR